MFILRSVMVLVWHELAYTYMHWICIVSLFDLKIVIFVWPFFLINISLFSSLCDSQNEDQIYIFDLLFFGHASIIWKILLNFLNSFVWNRFCQSQLNDNWLHYTFSFLNINNCSTNNIKPYPSLVNDVSIVLQKYSKQKWLIFGTHSIKSHHIFIVCLKWSDLSTWLLKSPWIDVRRDNNKNFSSKKIDFRWI